MSNNKQHVSLAVSIVITSTISSSSIGYIVTSIMIIICTKGSLKTRARARSEIQYAHLICPSNDKHTNYLIIVTMNRIKHGRSIERF